MLCRLVWYENYKYNNNNWIDEQQRTIWNKQLDIAVDIWTIRIGKRWRSVRIDGLIEKSDRVEYRGFIKSQSIVSDRSWVRVLERVDAEYAEYDW